MKPNREYKNSVFIMLFADEKALLELYNALTGSEYSPETKIEINTLQGILFLDAMNDLSFVLDGRIVILIEHQSTISENAPLRLLLYIARVYEKLIDKETIYRQKLVKIPRPEFIVLYNGKDPFPDEKTLSLSDAFIDDPKQAESLGKLEMSVRVININVGRNEEIINRSETLRGYVTFIGKIREYVDGGMKLEEAITEAVKYCEENGILQSFLREHASEVENMLTTEFKMAEAIKVWKEEGREEGIEIGRGEGIEIGRGEGMLRIISLLEAGKSIEEIKLTINHLPPPGTPLANP